MQRIDTKNGVRKISIIEKITQEISKELKRTAPELSSDQIDWRNKILNSNNPNFFGYGHKVSDIERIIKEIHMKYQCSFEDALNVSQNLMSSNIQEEKFAGFLFLNRFKKHFNHTTIELLERLLSENCDTWAFCDSICIRLIGPFLGKKKNEQLAIQTINNWSKSENLWVRRGSMVILLKTIMMKKEFNKDYVFKFVEKMLESSEDYIHKGIGWLLKTCSKYDPDAIFKYLMTNKERFPRLVLRYASEKLPKEKRALILKK
ncbi:MAG: DNA alkylation repair protein [Promethearchaeota archaeon]